MRAPKGSKKRYDMAVSLIAMFVQVRRRAASRSITLRLGGYSESPARALILLAMPSFKLLQGPIQPGIQPITTAGGGA
jgi:hypothetical protein